MSDELIETVAKAIYESDHAGGEEAINVAQWKALPNIVGMEQCRVEYIRCAKAALSAIEASGHRIVPVEPTEVMHDAGYGAANLFGGIEVPASELPDDVYRAMLAASPKIT